MAISANAVHEIRADASPGNINGGFFVTGASGTDFSQQAAAQWANLAVTSAGIGTTLLTASAAATMVGNGLKVISGTNATVGYYEITAVNPGVSITVDRNWCTGAVGDGVCNIGGAHSLGTATDDAIFELAIPGNVYYVRGASGTITIGGTISIAAAGTSTLPIKLIGYNSTRGDNPTGSTRPTILTTTVAVTLGLAWWCEYMQFSGTASTVLTMGNSCVLRHVKSLNLSGTAGRSAINSAGTHSVLYMCEAVALRGYAFISGQTNHHFFCWYHDSDMGVRLTGTSTPDSFYGCIFSGNVTAAFTSAGAQAGLRTISDCTFYGTEAKRGIGLDLVTGNTVTRVTNCIFYGFTTGMNHADAVNVLYSNYNNFFNNTTNRTNIMTGGNDLALNPSFANAAQLTGTTAITVAGNILRDTGKTFVTSGVTTDHYVYISSGTGVTAGKYAITNVAETELTLSPAIAADATGDKVYSISYKQNFATGAAMQGVGQPTTFPGGYTESNDSIGATTAEASGGGAIKSLGIPTIF
jgi:hypothetical protein